MCVPFYCSVSLFIARRSVFFITATLAVFPNTSSSACWICLVWSGGMLSRVFRDSKSASAYSLICVYICFLLSVMVGFILFGLVRPVMELGCGWQWKTERFRQRSAYVSSYLRFGFKECFREFCYFGYSLNHLHFCSVQPDRLIVL